MSWHRVVPLAFGATVPFVALGLAHLATSGHHTLAVWLTGAALIAARASGVAQGLANRHYAREAR